MDPAFYKSFVDEAPFGYACHKIVVDDSGKPVDYEFIEVNKAFEDQTGLRAKDIIGKKVSEVLPSIKKDPFDWIAYYGEAALQGGEKSFRQYSGPLKRWYEVKVYSPQEGYFNTAVLDITATMESIERLKKSEARYRGLVESENIMIVRVDRKNRFTFLNEKYCQTFGKTKEELIGHSFVPLIHEEDRRPTLEAMEKLKAPPYHCQLEQRAYTVDGWRWIHWEDHAVVDDDGNIVEVQGVGRDITDAKEREELLARKNFELESMLAHLKLQQERLAKAQLFTKTGLWEYHMHTGELYWSKECEALFGLEEGEFEGTYEAFLDRVHPDDRDLVLRENEPIVELRNAKTLQCEHRVLRKDGQTRWVRETAGVSRDAEGQSERIIGFVVDITEQKEVEQALENEEKFRQIVENFDGVFWLRDAVEHRILYISPNFEKLFGQKAEAIYQDIEAPMENIFEEDKAAVQDDMRAFRKTGILQTEFRLRSPDGQCRWIKTKGFPVRNAAGEVVRYGGFATDVTMLKESDAALIEAKEKAEESDRMKSAFLATMNHELRTPLNHIIGFSDILRSMAEDEETREFSENIHQSGNELLGMLEDIFELAIADEGGVRLNKERFSGIDLLEASKNALENTILAAGKGKRLKTAVNPSPEVLKSELFLDRGKLNQILYNLFKNAVKFTDQGTIEFGFHQEGGSSLAVYVKDNGIGIPEEKQKIIFDFFRQADESFTRKFEGMGIGLAISDRLAKVMNAKLCVESKEGEGAAFYLQIPDAVRGMVQESEQKGGSEAPNLANCTIMSVEDDPFSWTVLKSMLEPTGAKTMHAGNGREALELLNENPGVNLVLMDLHMPEMDGFEATGLIKEKWKSVPIIALTAYTLKASRESALKSGCDEVLAKPLTKDLLYKILEKHLRID